jgi:hypothetical protein
MRPDYHGISQPCGSDQNLLRGLFVAIATDALLWVNSCRSPAEHHSDGRVSVVIYKSENFQSDSAALNGSVSDLASWRLPSDRSRNWNNKISSIQVN